MMMAAYEKMSASQKNDDKMNQNRRHNVLSFTNQVVYSLPPLPSCKVTDAHDDITRPMLIEALKDRHRIKQMVISEYDNTVESIQSAMREVDSKLMAKDSIIHEQNNKLMEKDKIIQNNMVEIARLEKISEMQELDIRVLQETTQTWEDEKRSLHQELEAMEHRLQQELSDKKTMEQHMHNVISSIDDKWEKERDKRIKVQMEVQDNLWMKEEKLGQLKNIMMECFQSHPGPLAPDPQPSRPVREEQRSCFLDSLQVSQELDRLWTGDEGVEGNPRPACHVPSDLSVARYLSEWDLRVNLDRNQDYHAPSLPISCQSPAGSAVSRSMCVKRQPGEGSYPAFDLEVMKGSHLTETPMRQLHRRPRSADGDKWVHHKPLSTIDVGTVFQPTIPNAVQVSSPSKRNLLKSDGYALTHQELSSDGEITTKLMKGDVIKTRGGGRAVQFIDVETLDQKHIPVVVASY